MFNYFSKKKRAQSGLVHAKKYRFVVLYEPAKEGGYIVTCPKLPGLITEGDTLDEAREMAKDAIRLYIESLCEDGSQIPTEDLSPIEVTQTGIIEETVSVALVA